MDGSKMAFEFLFTGKSLGTKRTIKWVVLGVTDKVFVQIIFLRKISIAQFAVKQFQILMHSLNMSL